MSSRRSSRPSDKLRNSRSVDGDGGKPVNRTSNNNVSSGRGNSKVSTSGRRSAGASGIISTTRVSSSFSRPRKANNIDSLTPKVSAIKTTEVVERLPDEVLLILFSYLDASDLLVAARVCKRWLNIANDNMLWQKMYRKYLSKTKAGKDVGIPLDTPTLFWKKKCIEKSVELRNTSVKAKMNAVDMYTTLPERISPNLQKLGVKFTLAFYDGSGTHHYIRHDDCFYHRMSVSARWFSFENLPHVSRLQTLKVLALNPVFYDQKGYACKNSPCQRSLLAQFPLNWSEITTGEPMVSDSLVNIYSIYPELILAVWKDGGGIAYIVANFHYNQLVERCIQGTFTSAHIVRRPTGPPLNSIHGFFGYNVTVELRNQRQTIWSQQFRNATKYIRPDCICHLELISTSNEYHKPLDKPIQFLWKSNLIKSKTPNFCILDIAIRDDRGRLVWCVSDFVKTSPSDVELCFGVEDTETISYKCGQWEMSMAIETQSDNKVQKVVMMKISQKG